MVSRSRSMLLDPRKEVVEEEDLVEKGDQEDMAEAGVVDMGVVVEVVMVEAEVDMEIEMEDMVEVEAGAMEIVEEVVVEEAMVAAAEDVVDMVEATVVVMEEVIAEGMVEIVATMAMAMVVTMMEDTNHRLRTVSTSLLCMW